MRCSFRTASCENAEAQWRQGCRGLTEVGQVVFESWPSEEQYALFRSSRCLFETRIANPTNPSSQFPFQLIYGGNGDDVVNVRELIDQSKRIKGGRTRRKLVVLYRF
ncbi:hypothetical protein K2173_001465 [Erythroxylum novogranatense]|uniref:Uncharacterized protein n=1 Tax=Erythroxylum novogranatense TaxID=1862640 RepID=A0AAV8TR94_9ROSI|nr:hypothetical protein K2173_001465 [Erythroxylum novogranatense]